MKYFTHNLLFNLLFFSFFLDEITTIGVSPDKLVRAYIGVIPIRDIVLIIAFISFLISFQRIKSIIQIKHLVFYSFFLLAYLIIGIYIMKNDFAFVRSDLRVFLWFIGGISLANILSSTKDILRNLKFTLFILLCLFILSAITTEIFQLYSRGFLFERISHPNIYIFGFIIMGVGIIISQIERKKINSIIRNLTLLAVIMYFGVFLTATRSLLLQVAFVALILLFDYKNEQKRTKVISIITLLLLVLVASNFYNKVGISGGSRLNQGFDYNIILDDSRILEFFEFVKQSTLLTIFSGRGLGGFIKSPLFELQNTTSLHIGILNFWLKFGLIPTLIFIYMTMIKIPIKLLTSYRKFDQKIVDNTISANLIIYPVIVLWCISLLFSGGFSESVSLLIGISYYLYHLIKQEGVISFGNQ